MLGNIGSKSPDKRLVIEWPRNRNAWWPIVIPGRALPRPDPWRPDLQSLYAGPRRVRIMDEIIKEISPLDKCADSE